MSTTVEKYLACGVEPEAALADKLDEEFGHALQIPAYAETESLMDTLGSVPAGPMGRVLIVTVVNARADSPADVHEANGIAREQIARLFSSVRTISVDPPAQLFDHPHGSLLV
ncbi:MAG TPA: hypothetical protein VF999_09675, partial [Thermoanaerobaculia bacterium]